LLNRVLEVYHNMQCERVGEAVAKNSQDPHVDTFRGIQNDNCRLSYIPIPISTLPVQNEDCSSTTRGRRSRMFDMKEKITRPGI
jgi:hypothetical protein